MALALSILILHGLGDVPAPVFIGKLADTVSPKSTMLITLTWLGWAVVLWGVAWLISLYNRRREVAAERAAIYE